MLISGSYKLLTANTEPIVIINDRFCQPLPCEQYNSKLLVVIINGWQLALIFWSLLITACNKQVGPMCLPNCHLFPYSNSTAAELFLAAAPEKDSM